MNKQETKFPKVYVEKAINCHLDCVDEDIIIYVPAKASLINVVKNFRADGSHDVTSNVVFLWDKEEINIAPKFDENRKCLNSTEVRGNFSQISDCFDYINLRNDAILELLCEINDEEKEDIVQEYHRYLLDALIYAKEKNSQVYKNKIKIEDVVSQQL